MDDSWEILLYFSLTIFHFVSHIRSWFLKSQIWCSLPQCLKGPHIYMSWSHWHATRPSCMILNLHSIQGMNGQLHMHAPIFVSNYNFKKAFALQQIYFFVKLYSLLFTIIFKIFKPQTNKAVSCIVMWKNIEK